MCAFLILTLGSRNCVSAGKKLNELGEPAYIITKQLNSLTLGDEFMEHSLTNVKESSRSLLVALLT